MSLPIFEGSHSIDYYATAVGLSISVPFLFILGLLIRTARRHVPADRWLSRVMFAFAYVGAVGFVRIVFLQTAYVPWLSTVGWAVTSVCALVSLYYMRDELRYLPERRRERERLERLSRAEEQRSSSERNVNASNRT